MAVCIFVVVTKRQFVGAQYTINGEIKYTGTWGDIGTSSYYPPHHMTMGEGGCVYTDNELDFV